MTERAVGKHDVAARVRRPGGGESLRAERRAPRRGPRRGRSRRGRRARRPCRTGGWRRMPEKPRGSPGCGGRRPGPGSPSRGDVCCTASRRPGSRGIESAGAGSRRLSRRCGAGLTRLRAAPARAPGTQRRTAGCAARSLLRTPEPMRSPPSGRASTRSSASPLTSTRMPGVSTPSFMRSTRFVPPARNRTSGERLTSATAVAASPARTYANGLMSRRPRRRRGSRRRC